MLSFRRTILEPRSGARFDTFDLLRPDLRIRVIRTRRAVYDESLLYGPVAWSGDRSRPKLTVVLEGHNRDRQDGVQHWLSAGQCSLGMLGGVYWRAEADSTTLTVDWRVGCLGGDAPGGLAAGRISPRGMERLVARVEEIVRAGAAPAMGEVAADILAVLAAEGLPLATPAPADLEQSGGSVDRAVLSVLSGALSRLDQRPTSVDLEAGLACSRRGAIQLVQRVARRYALNGQTWRELVHRVRLSAAAALSFSARTEDLARCLGYRSPQALCVAMSREGLPSPQATRHALSQLR